ncbi:MAG TPA: TGS domain-containing protein, partial [Roseiflexaceae bacterium]|nr:TGS domain-containing protein [Roseiflexaceae bacterium]
MEHLDAALNPADHPALALLPPGATVRPRYRAIHDQLLAWGLPGWLAALGLLLRPIERRVVAPAAVAAALGPQAGETAAALAELSGPVPRQPLQHLERAWKTFVLMNLHPPAAVLKIAELLVRLRQTQDADIDERAEALVAVAQAASRLGMWDVRYELRDIAARLADPHLAQRAVALLDQTCELRARFFDDMRRQLDGLLGAQRIRARVERRQHPIYRLVEEGLESLHGPTPWADTVHVLVGSVPDCYRALGAINSAYRALGTRLRDYISGPKENGYQAIQTVIEYTSAPGQHAVPVAIHITTAAMAHFNRHGFLASLSGAPVPLDRPVWWEDRHRWLEAYRGRSGELFAFTPRGEAIMLPAGATVLDFAVRVHLELGVYCRGALLNGEYVSPGERLAPGDICEVLIDQHGGRVDQRMLDLAVTKPARTRIRRALQKGMDGAARGRAIFRELLARRLEQQGVHASEAQIEAQLAILCRWRGYQTVEAFFRAVARGETAPDRAVQAVVESVLVPRLAYDALPAPVRARAERVRLAQCCWPRPPQPVVAVAIHGGRQLKIHAAECGNAAGGGYSLAWRQDEEQTYAADVLYESWDRPELIHQLAAALDAVGGVNIRAFHAEVPEPSLARIRFSFEAPSREAIERVRQALLRQPEQRRVELRALTLIEGGFRDATPLDNPYGPQPVGRWPLFIGRTDEVGMIVARLTARDGARHVLVHGPKRIGKSSLLEHLSRYHLQEFRAPPPLDLQGLPASELRFARLVARLSELIAHKAGARAHASPLDPAVIERDPIRALGAFLADLRARNDLDRFVVLIDEMGVVARRLGGGLEHEFFDQWRALLNDEHVYQHLAFVVAMPDYALEQVAGEDDGHARPALRLGELGLSVRLGVLDEREARELITTPVRSHLEYAPGDVERLLAETGAHPYYIHL